MTQEWTHIADVSQIDEGQMQAVEVEGRRCLIVRAEGKFFLIDEMCSHEDYSLALGCIKGKRIKCSLHGSYFDLENGEALDEPADEPIATYRVKIDNNQLYADFT